MLNLVDVGLAVGGKPILHDLNLHVLPREIHAILGMNGSGTEPNGRTRWPSGMAAIVKLMGWLKTAH